MGSKSKQKKKQAAAQQQKAAAQQQKAAAGGSQNIAASTPPATASSAPKNGKPQAKSGGARTNKAAEPTNFVGRILGVLTLKPPIYREIAADLTAIPQAAGIVIVVSLIVAAVNYFASTQVAIPGAVDPARLHPLGRAIVMLIAMLLLWGLGSAVVAGVARNLFQGKTDIGEMLRVFGYTFIFFILFVLGVFGGFIPALASIAGLALGIVGIVIGIREAASFTTGRAAVVGIFSIVLVAIVVTFFTAFVLNPLVTTLLPT